MHAKREAGTEHGQPDPRIATLIREPSEARDDVLRQLRAENEQLRARGQFDRIALDAISQGVAIFDRDRRLILSNRRYAEIYRLTPDQIAPGMTLREIVELRTAVGTCPMSADTYLAVADFARAREEVDERVMSLVDGRSIRVRHAPASDGGWTSTHEDITELHEKRLLLEERLSLQSLIDATPDNLWVKDTQSRFVIANVVTARRMGRLSPKELIGKSDLELCPPETAEKYLTDERDILTTGRQLIDAEEYVLSPDGAKSWIATTKTPLRNERGEIIGIVGISRDITRRRRARMLLEGQAQILEMIASRTPLDQVLDQLLRIFESQMTER